MPSANQNNKAAAALDSLDQLPEGVRFRAGEVWAALESSLVARKRRVLAIRLAAAAIVVPVIVLAGWMQWSRQQAEGSPLPAFAWAHIKLLPKNMVTTEPASSHTRTAFTVVFSKPAQTEATPKATVEIQVTAPPVADKPRYDTTTTAAAATASVAAPATSRFRISHINDAPMSIPVTTEFPADDKSSYGFLRPAENGSGPRAADNATTEQAPPRPPRTLMTLLKSHQ